MSTKTDKASDSGVLLDDDSLGKVSGGVMAYPDDGPIKKPSDGIEADHDPGVVGGPGVINRIAGRPDTRYKNN